ncbi:MAG: hypothetical protein GX633_06470 [Clostridiales bacterium]|nr:hypothetical protein [Clostridiales bacterium]
MDRRVLLIAGGGTLGTYTELELLRLGYKVDVICLEEKIPCCDRVRHIKEYVSEELLLKLFQENRYDGIVSFMHYPNIQEYKKIHPFLSANTEHLIFLSSYRVYADCEHPIRETSPMLLDVSRDEEFLAKETYALSKAKGERYLRQESGTSNWTAVRPVISFSQRRFDIVMCSGRQVLTCAATGEALKLPAVTKNLTAGLDWAGNSGKLIANLLFKESTLGESYTVSSAQGYTWGEIAEMYTDLVGAKFEWIDTEEYMNFFRGNPNIWALLYDRMFDRGIDNSKILAATGLKKSDFTPIKEGIIRELRLAGWEI